MSLALSPARPCPPALPAPFAQPGRTPARTIRPTALAPTASAPGFGSGATVPGLPVPRVSVSGAPVPPVSVSAPSAASAAAAATAPVPPGGEPRPPAGPAAVHRAEPWHWRASAACRELSPAVVFARRIKDAAPALRACAVCPVRRECVQAVAPAQSLFDGVCGGRLWRNGRPAAVPSSSGSRRD